MPAPLMFVPTAGTPVPPTVTPERGERNGSGELVPALFEVPWTPRELVGELRAHGRVRVTGSDAVLRVAEHLAAANFGHEQVHVVHREHEVEVCIASAA